MSVIEPDLPTTQPGALRLWVQLAVYLVAIVLAYSALSERIARMEERQTLVQDEVRDIKADVKVLLRRP